MPKFADRVRETSSTTGTADFILTGAVAGFQTFAHGFGPEPIHNVAYAAYDSAGNWETGKGTLNNLVNLSRDLIRTSNLGAGMKSSFGAGLVVFCSPSAEHINNANIGLIYAQIRAAPLQ
jgi:hypothetical protein